jgi:hypothetical protein
MLPQGRLCEAQYFIFYTIPHANTLPALISRQPLFAETSATPGFVSFRARRPMAA